MNTAGGRISAEIVLIIRKQASQDKLINAFRTPIIYNAFIAAAGKKKIFFKP